MTDLINKALDRLKAGELSLGCGIRISGAPAIARTLAVADWDWLFIDLEHGTLSIESCANLSIAALGSGIAPLVRVPPKHLELATRALEGGALGIVMPNVETVAEVEALVETTKYRPIGLRNMGGPPVHTGYVPKKPDELAELFNSTTLTVAMVETPEAVEIVDEIAAVEGLDVVMMGCGDLTMNSGIPGQTGDPRIVESLEKLTKACKKHGKFAGIGGCGNPEHLQNYIKMGVQFILGGADSGLLAAAAAEQSSKLRALQD
jgi:4-hydroxy-2-oxoheptanedioate aldolase